MIKPADSRSALASERFIPGEDPYQRAWHLSRYVFAAKYVLDRDVLDAGSGEGYGAFFLSQVARSVTGVDYAPVAIEHARRKYARPNLEYHQMDLNILDGQGGPFDIITCFEVIEHIDDHDRLLAGFRQRLKPGGMLLLSTPNLLYNRMGADNQYHVSEVAPNVLRREVRRHFSRVTVLGQINRTSRRRAALKLVADPLYLRHRVQRTNQVSHEASTAKRLLSAPPSPPKDFAFSRILMRVCPVTIVLAVV